MDTIGVPVHLASERVNTNRGVGGKCSAVARTPSRTASPPLSSKQVHLSQVTTFRVLEVSTRGEAMGLINDMDNPVTHDTPRQQPLNADISKVKRKVFQNIEYE